MAGTWGRPKGTSPCPLETANSFLRCPFFVYKLPSFKADGGTSANSVEYRFDGLAEFVSRRGRVRLVEMLLGAGLSSRRIASEVGVTPRSVRRWLNPRETHPCNKNLDYLLELALRTDPNQTHEILLKELTLFVRLVSDRFNKKNI